jgi:hypothetical protein
MCESKMMNMRARDYDELSHDRVERTWEFVEEGSSVLRARTPTRKPQPDPTYPERKAASAGRSRHGSTRCDVRTAKWTGPGPSDFPTHGAALLTRAIGLVLRPDHQDINGSRLRRSNGRPLGRAGSMTLGRANYKIGIRHVES